MGDLVNFRPRKVEPADPLALYLKLRSARLAGLPKPTLSTREKEALAGWRAEMGRERRGDSPAGRG